MLTLDDEKEITNLLGAFLARDLHHDPRYLRLFQEYTGQRALYFHYATDHGDCLLPFFERPLKDVGGSIGEKDLVSPWYFGGPLNNFTDRDLAKESAQDFLKRLDGYCKDNGIVSQFQRLNPVLENHTFYGVDAGVRFNRHVASIELRKDLAGVRATYAHKVRKNIRRAHESGLRVERSFSADALRHFIRLYSASMDRKSAGTFYYFNDSFFDNLFRTLPNEAQLFTVYLGETAVTSSIAVGNGMILHDYLRAADPEYLHMRPNDLVVDEIAAWAHGEGYSEYVLGGGNSTKDDDPQLRFKCAFSGSTKDFYIYKKVHDRDRYVRRCVEEGKSATDLHYGESDYFPEYKTA